jgi:hypothetical protein
MKGDFRQGFYITSAKTRPRAHQWDCQAADGTLAPTAEQIWQTLGADEGDYTMSGELFQLDLAAQSL